MGAARGERLDFRVVERGDFLSMLPAPVEDREGITRGAHQRAGKDQPQTARGLPVALHTEAVMSGASAIANIIGSASAPMVRA